MILDATNETLEAVLAGAVASAQPHVTVCWTDLDAASGTLTPGSASTATNSTTAVTILAAPAASVQRVVDSIHVHNNDSASVALAIQHDAGGTERILKKETIPAGESRCWTRGAGWG